MRPQKNKEIQYILNRTQLIITNKKMFINLKDRMRSPTRFIVIFYSSSNALFLDYLSKNDKNISARGDPFLDNNITGF